MNHCVTRHAETGHSLAVCFGKVSRPRKNDASMSTKPHSNPHPCLARVPAGLARITIVLAAAMLTTLPVSKAQTADTPRQLELKLRQQRAAGPASAPFKIHLSDEKWEAKATAIIVCDSWDLHHSLNAVRRLEEFAPRLNQVLAEARQRGVTIIHAPSDCMEAYNQHPARRRAIQAPKALKAPPAVDQWCLRIPSEELAAYPIDQSDGGEDDDPKDKAAWVEHLKTLGRNPGMPWKKQADVLSIDAERDYVSSLGDEVWNVLEHRKIQNVILTGVHLNMCVLGRPFGLRQMARGGKKVALMRDMTDTMYNPARWPYVDHFTGTDLVIAHVERYVCPTITSDQLIGGKPFRFKNDHRAPGTDDAFAALPSAPKPASKADYTRRWVRVRVPGSWAETSSGALTGYQGVGWYRCVARFPIEWQGHEAVQLVMPGGAENCRVWVNGHELGLDVNQARRAYLIKPGMAAFGTGNWIVIRVQQAKGLTAAPVLEPKAAEGSASGLKLDGSWQLRIDDNPAYSNVTVPAQFAGPSDIVFQIP